MKKTRRFFGTASRLDPRLPSYSRQPGGFEGFGLAPEVAKRDSLALTPRRDLPGDRLGERVALHAVAANAHPRERDLSQVAYLLDLSAEVGGDAELVLQPGPETVVAAVRAAALQLDIERSELHVGVDEREEGIEVAPVEGVSRSVGQLNVLLTSSATNWRNAASTSPCRAASLKRFASSTFSCDIARAVSRGLGEGAEGDLPAQKTAGGGL